MVSVLAGVDGMVVSVFRFRLILLPAVDLQFPYMLCAVLTNQIAALLDPAELQIDSVYDLDFLVAVYKVV